MNNSTTSGLAALTATSVQQSIPPKKSRKKSAKGSQNQKAAMPSSVNQPKSKAAKAANATATAAATGKSSNPTVQEAAMPTSTPTPRSKKETDVVSKKHATKPQAFKITREKERKEKQQKQTAALAPSTTDVHTQPDAVKSRNHKLVLAPSLRSPNPCWSGRRPSLPTDSVADRLHDEILEYANYTRGTVAAMTIHIEQMITHVRGCVRTLWPKSTIEPFGSYSTGIWLPSSDVDLVILGVVEIHNRSLTVKFLRQLAQTLGSQPWVESLVVLDTAKIPVLKLVTAESSVPIDITFESSATHSGLLARDLIKRYADEMPELYPLAVVFKQLLRERDLNDAYTGGLSSYSIVLMIIHFQLLWRYGDRCFRAAAIFASGSPLPRPSDLIAEEERESKKLKEQDKTTVPTLTSSFAAVVARSNSLQRSASDDGKTDDTNNAKPVMPAQPFSYAAVAAGIVKLSTEDTTKPPVSYAAAVATPPQKASARAKASAAKTSDTLDAMSVTSSTADTEDISDGSSSTTMSAHEDAPMQQDAGTQQGEPVEISLGERTMTILEFFGIVFDYRKNGISIRDGGYIYRLADHIGGDLGNKMPSLVIEDPIHPDRNVSASSFAFSRVVAVFEDSFYALKYFRPTRFTPSALSCLLSTSGHSQHQYQQQFQNLLASKNNKTTVTSKVATVPTSRNGVAIAAK